MANKRKKSKKRKQRKKTQKKAGRPAAATNVFFFGQAAGEEAEMERALRYMAAHQLLAPEYPDMCDQEEELAAGLRCLEDPTASGAERLAAIMLLAHTPDARALDALQRYARSGAVHADMAELGAEECAMWSATSDEPPCPPPDVMLN